MSKSINRITLLGNLGKDADTHFTPNGTSVIKFAVATTRNWKDQATNEWKEQTDWTNVVVWRPDKLTSHLTKGKQVYVEGRLQTRNYEKNGQKVYVTEVVADQVIVLVENGSAAGRKYEAHRSTGRCQTTKRSTSEAFDNLGVSEDDLPS
jgi:single-strand DNA-binding protein